MAFWDHNVASSIGSSLAAPEGYMVKHKMDKPADEADKLCVGKFLIRIACQRSEATWSSTVSGSTAMNLPGITYNEPVFIQSVSVGLCYAVSADAVRSN